MSNRQTKEINRLIEEYEDTKKRGKKLETSITIKIKGFHFDFVTHRYDTPAKVEVINADCINTCILLSDKVTLSDKVLLSILEKSVRKL